MGRATGADSIDIVALSRRERAENGDPLAISEMLTLEMVEFLAPHHTRTSCSDENSNGNEYAPEHGVPRCARCALRALVLNHGKDPYGNKAVVRVNVDVQYGGDPVRYPDSRV